MKIVNIDAASNFNKKNFGRSLFLYIREGSVIPVKIRSTKIPKKRMIVFIRYSSFLF